MVTGDEGIIVEPGRHGWTATTRRWTDPDGTRREETLNTHREGGSFVANAWLPALTRWQRAQHTRWGKLTPQPWRGYIRCHGVPWRNGCPWNPTLKLLAIRQTVCRWRGHDLGECWPGYSVCWRCIADVYDEDQG